MITSKKKEITLEAFKIAVRPIKKLDLDEWSDLYRVLPKETSSEYGQWRTDRFPFLRRIMKCLSPSSRARNIIVIKGAQLGYTELAINLILYTADQNPQPLMYVQKTKDAAEDFSTQKLDPSIEVCPQVAKTLGKLKPKSLSNTVENKGFPGGFAVIGGANAGAFLRSKSIAFAVADEEDSFKASIDGEGSPIAMIRKRMANFPFSKYFRLSTPKIKETSTIEPAYLSGSQEQFYLPCPECNPKAEKVGTWWVIMWKNIKWPKNKKGEAILNPETQAPEIVELVCEMCGCFIPEYKKTWMLAHGKWMSEKDTPGDPYEVGDVVNPTFQISSLYSPLGFFSWVDAAQEWFEYKNTKDKALHQVFINQTLGESYSAAGRDVSAAWIYERTEEYMAPAPMGVLVITAGVDVQADRLEVDVTGMGLNDETWGIEYRVFWGNTELIGDKNGMDSYGQPTVWTLLDQFLFSRYKHETGAIMPIECTAIDSSYNTDTVNAFCRDKRHRRIFPIRGRDGWGKGLIERPKHLSEKHRTWRFVIWVDEVKTRVYALLSVESAGAGFQHFPANETYNRKYFDGLTAENKEVKYVNGSKVLFWNCPKGVRNEPLDCRVYALGAFYIYNPNIQFRSEQTSPLPMGGSGQIGSENYSNSTQNPIKVNKKLKKRSSKGVW